MAEHSVVIFDSTSHAIRAEKVLSGANLTIKMIPTPRQISADCGMALRFNQQEDERVASILQENGIPYKGIYSI